MATIALVAGSLVSQYHASSMALNKNGFSQDKVLQQILRWAVAAATLPFLAGCKAWYCDEI